MMSVTYRTHWTNVGLSIPPSINLFCAICKRRLKDVSGQFERGGKKIIVSDFGTDGLADVKFPRRGFLACWSGGKSIRPVDAPRD